MESVLGRLVLRHSSEQQAWQPVLRRSDLKLVRIVVHDHPAQG